MQWRVHWSSRSASTSFIVAAAFLVGATSVAHAQLVRGVVRDVVTTTPLDGVSLVLVTLSDSIVSTTISDGEGEFALRAADPGRYRVRLRRIGFKEARTDPIELRRAETVVVDLALAPVASRLTPVRVTERRRLTRGNELMAMRESRGKGVFLRQTEIQDLGGARVSDVLEQVDGLRVNLPHMFARRRTVQSGQRIGEFEVVTSTMGWGCLHILVNGGHMVRFFQNNDPPIWLNDMVRPKDIAGIEIYREFREVPPDLRFFAWPASAEYAGITPDGRVTFNSMTASKPCGLVFIWTHEAW